MQKIKAEGWFLSDVANPTALCMFCALSTSDKLMAKRPDVSSPEKTHTNCKMKASCQH
jgi:hypothetical protein